MKIIIVLSAIVCFMQGTKAAPKVALKIVGGATVEIKSAPWQVALVYTKTNVSFCGGSIINVNWILTAAHCTKGEQKNDYYIRAGSKNFKEGGTVVKIDFKLPHAMYNFHYGYDFSLIKLKTPLTLGPTIQPIAFATMKTKIADGTMCSVSGWGLTSVNKTARDVNLRSVNVPIFNWATCKSLYAANEIVESNVCAGYKEGGKDTCTHDSGGPLVCGNILVGVVSGGDGCGAPNKPGVYGKVASVSDWIGKNTFK